MNIETQMLDRLDITEQILTPVKIEEFIGKTFDKIFEVKRHEAGIGGERDYIVFEVTDEWGYVMMHQGYSHEYVYIKDICGNLRDLVSSPILKAECKLSDSWAFYEFATIEGLVTIMWDENDDEIYSVCVGIYKYERRNSNKAQ